MQEICKEDLTLVGTTIHKTTSYIWIKNSNYVNYNLASFLIKAFQRSSYNPIVYVLVY
jgi:hypothetical protein